MTGGLHAFHYDFTECSGSESADPATTFPDTLHWHTANLTVGAMRNWAKTVITWNLALDPAGVLLSQLSFTAITKVEPSGFRNATSCTVPAPVLDPIRTAPGRTNFAAWLSTY